MSKPVSTTKTNNLIESFKMEGTEAVAKFTARLRTTREKYFETMITSLSDVKFPSVGLKLGGPCTDDDLVDLIARYGWTYETNERVQPFTYMLRYHPKIRSSSRESINPFPHLEEQLLDITKAYLGGALDLVKVAMEKSTTESFTVRCDIDFPDWIIVFYQHVFQQLEFNWASAKVIEVTLTPVIQVPK